jgi:hypothetical protein
MSGKAENEGPSAPGFHTTSPLHEKQRDTRALPGCYKIYPTLRISGAFVWFCNSLQTPGVEGFGPSCKSVLFKAASNQNLLSPTTCHPEPKHIQTAGSVRQTLRAQVRDRLRCRVRARPSPYLYAQMSEAKSAVPCSLPLSFLSVTERHKA